MNLPPAKAENRIRYFVYACQNITFSVKEAVKLECRWFGICLGVMQDRPHVWYHCYTFWYLVSIVFIIFYQTVSDSQGSYGIPPQKL